MAKLERFEELSSWQEARILVKLIYRLTLNETFDSDRDLVRQMRRSAVSVMANIAEGFSRYSFKDSKQFYVTARGSLSELHSHVYVASDLLYLDDTDFNAVQNQVEITGKLLNGLIRNAQRRLEVVETDKTIEQLSR